MKPEEAIKYINGAMSLRIPQAKSLKLFADYLQAPAGQKLLTRLEKKTRVNTRGNFGGKQGILCRCSRSPRV